MHEPVLLKEVIDFLAPKSGEFFIDGTVDGGGHAQAIIERISPNGTFLGLDWDEFMIESLKKRFKPNKSKIILVNENFKNIPMILKKQNLGKADGLLLDLGFSSEQLESAGWRTGRGFSFRRDEPLLMTYSTKEKPAHRWLNELSESKIFQIIKEFGEERFAGRIAKNIKKNLPITTTGRLAEVILKSVPKNYERGRIHPATRTFQALRIFVNRELENLNFVLDSLPQILNSGGRAAIISFHSLEDRSVKNSFRNLAKNGEAVLLTKKPIVPGRAEILSNPRSRSAKLRTIKVL